MEEEIFVSELEKKRAVLLSLREELVRQGVDIKGKIAKAKSDAYLKKKYVNTETFQEWERQKVDNSCELQSLQNEIGAITRQIKKQDQKESDQENRSTRGMFDRLFVEISKDVLSEEQYNEIYLQTKIKMLDI